jgi:hypothetical protein
MSEQDIWEIARRYVGEPLQKAVLARGDLSSLKVYENQLAVTPAPDPHPAHANITGWNQASTETRLIAIKLADAASLVLAPPAQAL